MGELGIMLKPMILLSDNISAICFARTGIQDNIAHWGLMLLHLSKKGEGIEYGDKE